MDSKEIERRKAREKSLKDKNSALETAEARGIEKGVAIGKAEGVAIGKAEGVAIGKAEGVAIGEARGVAIGEARGVAIGEARGVEKEKIKAILRAAAEGCSKELIMSITQCSEELYEKAMKEKGN